MFVDVPIKVQVPPNNAEKEIGISNLAGLILASLHTSRATGINMATTAESFINAERTAEVVQSETSARK